MASIYKPRRPRKDRGPASWYFTFKDHTGRRRSVRGCPDRTATEAMARRLESEADLRRRGVLDPRHDQYAAHAARPLVDHVDDWRNYLMGKGDTERHAREGHARVLKLLDQASAVSLSDLSLSRIQTALAELRAQENLAARTVHHYTRLVKNLTRWLHRDGRIAADLLAHLQTPAHVEAERRHVRRVLTDAELRALLEATAQGPPFRTFTAGDRVVLYRLACGTGFRVSELASLTPESFDLAAEPPTVVCEAGHSKRRRRDVQPLKSSLARILRPWLDSKPPETRLFRLTRHFSAQMLRLDLEAAGLPYADEDGRVADFHSLRAVYITALAKSRRRSSSCKAWRDTPIPGSRSTPTPRSVSTTKPTRSRRFPTWTPPFSRTTPRRPWRPGPIPLR